MKASELRIGNYVMLDDGRNDGEIIMITGTNAINGGHVYDEDDGIYGCDMIQPIPLTEQWLMDFGFEKRYSEWLGEICLEEDFEGIYYSASEGLKLSPYLKYVHQLQNLYFALTGEELTIKEKANGSK